MEYIANLRLAAKKKVGLVRFELTIDGSLRY